jgi:hypothetical protein
MPSRAIVTSVREVGEPDDELLSDRIFPLAN